MSPVTVRSALAAQAFQRGSPEVVAGADHLDREVRWVHSFEASHIATLLSGGELLLTTGICIGPHQDRQRQLVADLCQRGITGLVLELGPILDKVPAALVDEAERRGLPVVALHREIPFVDVIEVLHREIVDRGAESRARADAIQARLASLILAGEGIAGALDELARALGNPVVLARNGVGPLYHASADAPVVSVFAAWDAHQRDPHQMPRAVSVEIHLGGEKCWGHVVALAVNSACSPEDRIAVERAATVLAMALYGERTDAVLARDRGNFLAMLLGDELTESDAAAWALTLGFRRRDPLLVPVACYFPGSEATGTVRSRASMYGRLAGESGRDLAAAGIPALTGTQADSQAVLLLVGLESAGARAATAARVAQRIRAVAGKRVRSPDRITICVGAVAASWKRAGANLREVLDAAPARHDDRGRGWQDITAPTLDELLYSLAGSRDLEHFVRSRLQRLLEYDHPRNAKLLPTLEMFCALGGHKVQTARELHLDRKSLYARLRRIEALLDVQLSDPSVRIELELAIRARRQMERHGAWPAVDRR